MLNPRFKSLHFVSFFIGCEEVNIVKEYHRQSFYPMLLKMLSLFIPNGKIRSWICKSHKRCKIWFGYFKQTPNTSESTIELVAKEMLIFRHYQVDFNEIKCLLEWWAKHETMFIIVDFLAQEILRIVGSQIETKRILFP